MIVAIASDQGGTGTTTVAAALAHRLLGKHPSCWLTRM